MPRRVLASLTAAAALGVAVSVSGAGPAAADGAPSPSCAQVVRIDSLAFDPAEITAGGTSALELVATNCTGQSQAVSETWAGSWLSATATGIPSGCPVIDPLPRQVTFAPHARVSTTTTYLVFPGCTASALRVTVTVSQAGTQLARRSADLLIDHSA
ncbi:hypothetical protein ACFO3J_07740 [Streptomyces polygonati]|uniref:Uncharacterized protein n=1 Tax=Streptomyces polygonati TaxID=1617087 RepID=A0ABV8HMH0_9ACTN